MKKIKKESYVCQRCAMSAPTCCRLGSAQRGGAGGDCFPLSHAEQRRIENALASSVGKRTDVGAVLLLKTAAKAHDEPSGQDKWAVEEVNSTAFIQAMCNLFPAEKARVKEVFPQNASHYRLALDKDGSCAFLTEYGCALPRRARPWFCRIFPFWVVGGIVQCFQDEGCLAVKEYGGNFIQLTGAFDSSPDDIMDRYKKLRADWGVR